MSEKPFLGFVFGLFFGSSLGRVQTTLVFLLIRARDWSPLALRSLLICCFWCMESTVLQTYLLFSVAFQFFYYRHDESNPPMSPWCLAFVWIRCIALHFLELCVLLLTRSSMLAAICSAPFIRSLVGRVPCAVLNANRLSIKSRCCVSCCIHVEKRFGRNALQVLHMPC